MTDNIFNDERLKWVQDNDMKVFFECEKKALDNLLNEKKSNMIVISTLILDTQIELSKANEQVFRRYQNKEGVFERFANNDILLRNIVRKYAIVNNNKLKEHGCTGNLEIMD